MMFVMRTKQLTRIHQSSQTHWVGNGFPVRSVFSYDDLGRELSPFLLLDYAAPHEFSATDQRRGVGAHPHKGFETVTICYQGELEHRDSSGGGGTIGPGDVQWMTAGGGIIHEEFHSQGFAQRGGTLQMVQLWVNLRSQDKGQPARYQTLPAQQMAIVALPNDMGTVHVIAGEYNEHRGPAETFTPINLWDVRANRGSGVQLPVPDGHTTTLFVIAGAITFPGDRQAAEGDLAMFARAGDAIEFHATDDSVLLLMDGLPIDEPIVGKGPFVMNTEAEIQQAFAEFRAGAMGQL